MELPGTNDSGSDDNNANSEERQSKESFENATSDTTAAAAAAGSVKTTEVPAESVERDTIESGKDSSRVVASMSGKRDHDGQNITVATATTVSSTGMGIVGGNNAKRGKREWLSFRGSRETRVGENYQVTSLPPVEANTETDNTTSNGKGK